MPDTIAIPSSDAPENGNCQISQPGQGSIYPSALYSQPGCNGRIFLRDGDSSTTIIDSTRYSPQFPDPLIVIPPLKLFDRAGRMFCLDLEKPYVPGKGIWYWLNENPNPETYVEGVDYIGELLRHAYNENQQR